MFTFTPPTKTRERERERDRNREALTDAMTEIEAWVVYEFTPVTKVKPASLSPDSPTCFTPPAPPTSASVRGLQPGLSVYSHHHKLSLNSSVLTVHSQ